MERDVLIVGAGPTGLMLAAELALAGASVAVVERRTDHGLAGSRAGGLTSRTLEVLDQRGVVDRFLARGRTGQLGHFSQLALDVGDLPTRHAYGLALPQYRVEAILTDWVGELDVPIHRGNRVTGVAQDDAGVDVELSDGSHRRTRYLVGCDGGRSLVRTVAGIDFVGWEPTTSCLVADVDMTDEPPWGLHRDTTGFHSFFQLEENGPVRVMVAAPYVGDTAEPTLADVCARIVAVRGTDFGMRSAAWISRFTDVTRQATAYRRGRVMLAGDAAHVHFPIGGQGLNTGIQDAVNLGWKLAQVVDGTSAATLLDSYHAERHPVGAAVLRNAMAQTALIGPGVRVAALRDTVSGLLSMDEPRRRIAATMCGLDIHYDLGVGHPLLGRRVPELDLTTPDGPRRLFTLLHQARALLLNVAAPLDLDVTPWRHRVSALDAQYTGRWELPVFGDVEAPSAVLVRPDGYVAWVGDGTAAGLRETLDAWFA